MQNAKLEEIDVKETAPLTIVAKSSKHLEINVKDVKDLYDKNCKSLLEDIKADTKK